MASVSSPGNRWKITRVIEYVFVNYMMCPNIVIYVGINVNVENVRNVITICIQIKNYNFNPYKSMPLLLQITIQYTVSW